MGIDIQKAGLWKRIAAWILDIMLIAVLAVGAVWGLSVVLGYDSYSDTLENAYAKYGENLQITQQTYQGMTPEEKQDYDNVMYAYNMVISLSLLMTTLGILFAVLVLEFIVPLILKNGQTVGKKCFSLGVIRTDGVKMNTMQLFVRTFLGKYTFEIMVPVYIVLMIYMELLGLTGTLILGALLLTQMFCVSLHRNHAAIHDLLAGTVVVDIGSQKVFENTEELLEFTKRLHAERAQRQDY